MKKIILIVLLSVFLLSAMIVPSLSQVDMTVGVSVGDSFTFVQESMSLTADNDDVEISMFATPWLYLNESDYVTYTVADVDDAAKIITFDVLTHWSNGTETTVQAEEAIEESYTYMAIGANMEAGDVIREASFLPERTINETITMEYVDESRETNVHYAVWDFSMFGAGISERDYYWDKETGMKVKEVIRYDEDLDQGAIHLEQTVVLTDTSLWVVPEFPTGTVMLLVFIAITVSIDLYRRKTLKH